MRDEPLNEKNIDSYRLALVDIQTKYPLYELKSIKVIAQETNIVSFAIVLKSLLYPERPMLKRVIKVYTNNNF